MTASHLLQKVFCSHKHPVDRWATMENISHTKDNIYDIHWNPIWFRRPNCKYDRRMPWRSDVQVLSGIEVIVAIELFVARCVHTERNLTRLRPELITGNSLFAMRLKSQQNEPRQSLASHRTREATTRRANSCFQIACLDFLHRSLSTEACSHVSERTSLNLLHVCCCRFLHSRESFLFMQHPACYNA